MPFGTPYFIVIIIGLYLHYYIFFASTLLVFLSVLPTPERPVCCFCTFNKMGMVTLLKI